MIVNPCGICDKAVAKNHNAIQCDICHNIIHIRCNKLDKKDYQMYQNNKKKDPTETFICLKCSEQNIPFSALNDNQFEIIVRKGVNFPLDSEE